MIDLAQAPGTAYAYVAQFLNNASATIANGATGIANILIDGNTDFVDDMWIGMPVLAALTANIGNAGTPLALEPDPSPVAAEFNTMPSAWSVLVQIEVPDGKLFDNPLPWPTVFGPASTPMIMLTRRLFKANTNIKLTITNNCGQSISASGVIHGRKIYPNSARGR